MGISKNWLQEQIEFAVSKRDELPDKSEEWMLYHGKILALKIVYAKLTEPPKPAGVKTTDKKDFDPHKIFEAIVRFYVDKQGYSKERANSIAMKIVDEQIQKRMDKYT